MAVEVLVATMDQKDDLLWKRMNIQSAAIIGNQCDRNEIRTMMCNGRRITYLNFAERGVGLNRNNTLMRANEDICLLADDDMRYVDDYPKIVEEQFKCLPDADVIIFNLQEKNGKYVIRKPFRVTFKNFMRFGAARIAFRRKSIYDNGIFFNLTFGGGTEHGSGEDTLFLAECLRKGLKIYAVPIVLAELTEERESSWFRGYDEKYFKDKGILYKRISRRWYKLLCLQDAMRHSKLYEMPWMKAYKLMNS